MSTFDKADNARIDEIVQRLRKAESILFITGAGVSADSGLPTYRGIGGLYNDQNTQEDLPIEVLLSGEMLRRRPEWTWKYLLQIENACRGAKPNRAHEVMAEMENHFDRVWVLTQNVDGFHRQAGSVNVIEMHGNLHGILCTSCSRGMVVEDYSHFELPPRCEHCFGYLRPDVVLFGEHLQERETAKYHSQMKQGFDVVFSVGTTSVFPYIAAPMIESHDAGKTTIEINPGETDVTEFATIKLALGAADALDAIWNRYKP